MRKQRVRATSWFSLAVKALFGYLIDSLKQLGLHSQTAAKKPLFRRFWRKLTIMSNIMQEDQISSGIQFGKYQVYAKLATGGMAELFIAKQQGLAGISKTVVIKCVLPHLAQSSDFLEMFLDEARVATMLQHPNIVQIFEVGQVHDVYYIAMEYIRGVDLKRLRKQLYGDESFRKDVPYGLFAGIISQAAAGLHHAHNATDEDGNPLHIIHRDVSPNNLLVSFNGTVKLVDFGVAKATTQEHRTRVGMLKGRLSYMSPEQISGQPVTPASDVFALGIVLYELSTNQRLFKRQHEAETVQAVLKHPIPLPSDIVPNYPPALEKIVMRSLERDTAARYQTAEEMRLDLEAFMREYGHFGASQIAKILDLHFGEEKRLSSTGVMQTPFSPNDLQYLAYRTGQFNARSSGSHPHMLPPTSNPQNASFSSGGSASSFGSFQDQDNDVKSMVFEPPKSRATLVLVLLLTIALLVGGIAVYWGLFAPQNKGETLDPQKLQAMIGAHQKQLDAMIAKKSFRKALDHLNALQLSAEGKLLDNWIRDTRQMIHLEAKNHERTNQTPPTDRPTTPPTDRPTTPPTDRPTTPPTDRPTTPPSPDRDAAPPTNESTPTPRRKIRSYAVKKRYREIRITSTPQGAQIYSAQKEYLGKTPLTVKVPLNQAFSIQVKKGGFFSRKHVIPAQSKEKSIHLRLREINIEIP
jgi:serine/threonine protein kinase